ncbi:Dihydropyrimidinase [Fasciola gigantica]|uniref:dihydropyrimidinase n=1 Tax=Fasciola gigantica TaxID=46835 RepID=A0A504YJY0_FASGI|nr:Dihydropyrimidinase [Fasciola gigantica]
MNDSKIQVGLKKLPLHLQSSQNRLLIKGGKVVNDDRSFFADIYIEDGIIRQVGTQLTIPGGVRIIDATGKMVIPGGVDPHTHMQMQFMGTASADDFYTGTKAALAGGTTTIIDIVRPSRGESVSKAYDHYRECADPKVCCDYALHVIIPHFDDKVAEEMELLVKERGVNSFEVFMANMDDLLLEDDDLFKVFLKSKELGALAMVHAENGKLIKILQDTVFKKGITGPEGHLYSRPEAAELEATNRAITIAESAKCPLYVMNVMSASAARSIAEARRQGCMVFGETIAAALGTNGRNYTNPSWSHAAAHVMSPPLRPNPENSQELMRCLATGELDCASSDHWAFRIDQKALGKDDFRLIPNGLNGVEDRMSVVWEKGVMTGLIDPCKFVALTSTNAAKLFNLYPRKGRIESGSDADLVIWDGDAVRTISASTHHQNMDFNVFEGMQCHGVPLFVLTGGRIVLDDGELRVSQGAGRFLPTAPYASHVYDRVKQLDLSRAVVPIRREPYTGPISTEFVPPEEAKSVINGTHKVDPGPDGDVPRARSPTRGGCRNMQESSFSLSGKHFPAGQCYLIHTTHLFLCCPWNWWHF